MLPTTLIPPEFQETLHHKWELWSHRASDEQQQALTEWMSEQPEQAAQLARVWVASDYVAQIAIDHPSVFTDWLQKKWMTTPLSQTEMCAYLDRSLDGAGDDKGFDRALRQFRRDMMLRIVWRDLCRLAPMTETTADMTALAEVVIQAAIRYHHESLSSRFGKPIGHFSGEEQPLVVLGMGKMGGYELNVSSDIDLIFTYPESGETEGGRKSISNQEYFLKLGQKLISSIDTNTVDGFVFRVDMRLRPYGQSGPLVANFDSLEGYYQTQGREWERYAMIKARVVSGDVMHGAKVAGEQLMDMLRRFTYRRYLDFSAIDSMRDMKSLINREVQRKGISANVKLGPGGIREVEFIVQVFQMIRGGRDDRLRERRVLKLLPLLEEESLLPVGAATELADAYLFLRDTEHAIQGYQDKQTQSLPQDDQGLQRLAWVMGFDDPPGFLAALDRHRAIVHEHFQQLIAEPEGADDQQDDLREWELLWPKGVGVQHESPEPDVWAEYLGAAGLIDAEGMAVVLSRFASSQALAVMQPEGRVRLDALLPRLLKLLAQEQSRAEALERVLTLVAAVTRRTVYLLLLVENPGALQQLVRLCTASSWIAEQLARHPVLLDELLDPRSLYQPPNKQVLQDELRQQMLRVSWDDIEGQMEALRYFRMAHGLRVAACEVSGALPLMQVSDYLTWLAEVILEHVVALAWEQMRVRHGLPAALDGQPEPEFIVVGYGKLGGIELGHGSDLDLVFVHDAAANGYSDGEKSLDNQTYFIRLGQKIIHILNTQTISGQLYEVDMRLRPSGNSGLLVSSLVAFEKYQRQEAWTWEHQALVRARVVTGGSRLSEQFNQLRHDILAQPRDPEALRLEVSNMREKMRDHLGSQGTAEEKAAQFHLKQDAGGMVDIEFLVQFWVLVMAHEAPALTRWSDNIRILESLRAENLLTSQEEVQLAEAYKVYRSAGHRLNLQRQSGVVGGDEFVAERANVSAVWARYLTA